MKELVVSVLLLLVAQKAYGNPGNGQGAQTEVKNVQESGGPQQETHYLTSRQQEGSAKSDKESPKEEFQVGYGGGYVRKSKDGDSSLQNQQVGESVLSPYGAVGAVHETLGPLGSLGLGLRHGQYGRYSGAGAVADLKHQLHADILGKELLSEALHQKQRLNADILHSQRANAEILDKQLLKADLLDKERINSEILDKELYETQVLTQHRLHAAIRDKQQLTAAILEKEKLSVAIQEKQRLNAAILEKGKVEAAIVEKQLLEAELLNKQRLNAALFDKQRLAAAIVEKERLIEDIVAKQRLNAAVYNKQTLNSAVLDKEIGKSLASIRANQELAHLAKEKLVGTVASLGKPLAGYGLGLGLRPLHGDRPSLLSPVGPRPDGIFTAAGPPYGKPDALVKEAGIYGSLQGSVGPLYETPYGGLGAAKALAASVSLGGSSLGASAFLKASPPLYAGGYGGPLVAKPLAAVAPVAPLVPVAPLGPVGGPYAGGPGPADYYDYDAAPVPPPKPATVTVITPIYGRPGPGGYLNKQPLQTVVVKDKLPPPSGPYYGNVYDSPPYSGGHYYSGRASVKYAASGPGPYGNGYDSPPHSGGHYYSDRASVNYEASGPAPVVVNHNSSPSYHGPQSVSGNKPHNHVESGGAPAPYGYSYKMTPGSFNQPQNYGGPVSILDRVDKAVTSKALGTTYSLIGKALSFTH